MTALIELQAMRRAIALSAFGLGSSSPNPPVGCVILDANGRVVGDGFHLRKGDAHAEVNALTAAGDRARGGTAIVTLEPCNHHGRTPPCHQAIIDAGISRVVIALIDPTSRQEGGAARLRAAGVDVEVGVLDEEARLVLQPWLTGLTTRRPHVHWIYSTDTGGEILDLEDVRVSVDAVLLPNGQLLEGKPQSHRPDVFSLPESASDLEISDDLLADLYNRGVRSILVAGEPIHHEKFVDEITVQIPVRRSSSRPYSLGLGNVPARFRLKSVTKTSRYVRLVLEPEKSAGVPRG